MNLPKPRNKKDLKAVAGGFTLIELLLVIVIISSLAVVVFVALNPGQRLRDARDSRRTTDVDTILTAIHAYIIDNKGALPAGLSTGMSEVQLGSGATGCAVATGGCSVVATSCVNLSAPLVKYLKSMPIDPNGATAAASNYSVVVDANNMVTVKACGIEGTSNIWSSR